MLGKTILFSGGKYDIAFIKQYLADKSFDTVACADSGLEAAHAVGVNVDYIMGDFDSVSQETLAEYRSADKAAKFVQYPKAKDYTDTQMVLEWILSEGASEITILGATGGRLDHFLSNLNILMKPLKQGIPAYIVDSHNRLYLIDGETVYPVTLTGFQYGLKDYTLTYGDGRAISNEFAPEAQTATISFTHGELIVIESRD